MTAETVKNNCRIENKKGNAMLKNIKKHRYLLLMLTPGLLYFVIFRYIPIYGVLMAFQDYSLKYGVLGSKWVGLKHFISLFSGGDFQLVLKNTVLISFLKIICGFPAPIILALLFNELKDGYYKKITQTISYAPHFFSWVVVSGMLTSLLSPSVGMVNKIIQALGGQPIYFLADKNWFVQIIIMSDIWKEVGWGSIIYLAALAGINYEMHEAAVIDGASRIKRMVYINIPNILPTIATMLILRMGSLLDAGFDQIFNLESVAVRDVSDIIDTYVYRMGVGSFQYSFASAAGLFKSVIGIAMVLLTNRIARRLSDGESSIW
ncbi:MAG: ABC transporter permease subunit [Firmicutes bacterium]|nr:ABC transporter permease subunit [Bacillota bacterium]